MMNLDYHTDHFNPYQKAQSQSRKCFKPRRKQDGMTLGRKAK